jgi:CheY-like chemotaxis protein
MAHKLLLADDSVTIQRVIELTFADEDVEVTTVGDGQMAIDRLETDPPDIILADVDMPKRDGYEVAAYVKSRPKLAHIPVVLLTGAFEPIDQARATAAGSSDVLAKPFEPQMVINRVRELLGKKRPDDDGVYASHEAGAPQSMQPALGNPQPAGEGTQQPVSLDDYFDQLDAAFSNLQPGAPPAEAAEEMDWPVQTPAAAEVEPEPFLPPLPPPSARQAPPPVVVAPVEPPVAPAPNPVFAAPSAAAANPVSSTFAAQPPVAPIAPTFAPLGHTASVDRPVAPSVPSAPNAPSAPVAPKNPFANLSAAKAEAAARPAPAAPVITDEVIEEIVSRVIQRMTDRVVRETVADVVSQTAERLVQEEIERIRTGS